MQSDVNVEPCAGKMTAVKDNKPRITRGCDEEANFPCFEIPLPGPDEVSARERFIKRDIFCLHFYLR